MCARLDAPESELFDDGGGLALDRVTHRDDARQCVIERDDDHLCEENDREDIQWARARGDGAGCDGADRVAVTRSDRRSRQEECIGEMRAPFRCGDV
eukprot:6173824-Pleurochrysis_carterae.AAC.2